MSPSLGDRPAVGVTSGEPGRKLAQPRTTGLRTWPAGQCGRRPPIGLAGNGEAGHPALWPPLRGTRSGALGLIAPVHGRTLNISTSLLLHNDSQAIGTALKLLSTGTSPVAWIVNAGAAPPPCNFHRPGMLATPPAPTALWSGTGSASFNHPGCATSFLRTGNRCPDLNTVGRRPRCGAPSPPSLRLPHALVGTPTTEGPGTVRQSRQLANDDLNTVAMLGFRRFPQESQAQSVPPVILTPGPR